jgi:7-cyano-7-deazaguanine synthase
MDSAVALAEARALGFECHALSFDYGQRHKVELDAAARVSEALGAQEQRVVRVDLSALGGSALTDAIEVPKDRVEAEIGRGVPSTYVPARNTVFLGVALAWAEVLGAREIFVGINALDYSGYPDCRPEFLRAFEELARLATAAGTEESAHFRVHAPLMQMTKAAIVKRGLELGVDFELTHSCYDPFVRGVEVRACGRCDACQLRKKGFSEAKVPDPTRYV